MAFPTHRDEYQRIRQNLRRVAPLSYFIHRLSTIESAEDEMTTINTSDDLIRVLRENPEFRATIRRELLTAELLAVPQGISALLEHARATNRRLDDIEGDVKVVKSDIDGLGEAFRVEIRAQSSFRGNYAQSAASKEDLEIADLFAGLYGITSSETSQVSRSELAAWLRENADALEALDLRPRAFRTFRRPDMIMGVRDLYADGDTDPEFYIAIEASYTADSEDILRATEHAKILRAVTGLDAYPVVAAVRLDDEMVPEMEASLFSDVDRFIEANDADAALWYRLESADLRPREPR